MASQRMTWLGLKSLKHSAPCVEHLLNLLPVCLVQHLLPMSSSSWSVSCTHIMTSVGCCDDKSVYLYNVVCTATPQQLYLDIQDAVQGVTQAAASAGASGHGKLDRSLKKLLLSVDAASSSDRLAVPVWVCSVVDMLDCAHVGAMALDLHTF